MSSSAGPIEKIVRTKLENAEMLSPIKELELINESSGHNVPAGSETHWKVLVVSEAFQGKAPLARHRMLNGILAEELDPQNKMIHALSINAYTPKQWEKKKSIGKGIERSPPCLGGDGSLPSKK